MNRIDWSNLIARQDVEGIWNGLYQLVSRHPLLRPLHFATGPVACISQEEINAALTQEFFLEMLKEQRFEHYVKSNFTSAEIEFEITQVEMPRLVGWRAGIMNSSRLNEEFTPC